MSKYPNTNIAVEGGVSGDPFIVDQSVGEITSYDLIDSKGFLHLSVNGAPVIIAVDKIICMVGSNAGRT